MYKGQKIPIDYNLYDKECLSVLKKGCLLYTSDAADERSSVDLGGRRIIKKKNNIANADFIKRIKKNHQTNDTHKVARQPSCYNLIQPLYQQRMPKKIKKTRH